MLCMVEGGDCCSLLYRYYMEGKVDIAKNRKVSEICECNLGGWRLP